MGLVVAIDELLDVGPGGEDLGESGFDDDDVDGVILFEGGEGGANLVPHGCREGVEVLGTGESDVADAIVRSGSS